MPEDITITVPIEPKIVPKAIELWKAYYQKCSLEAGSSSGPDEKQLVLQTPDGTSHPSEIQRMKEATKR